MSNKKKGRQGNGVSSSSRSRSDRKSPHGSRRRGAGRIHEFNAAARAIADRQLAEAQSLFKTLPPWEKPVAPVRLVVEIQRPVANKR